MAFGDLRRRIAEAVLRPILEADAEGLIGAGRDERSGERTAWREGDRERAPDTRSGASTLRVPKLRQGCEFLNRPLTGEWPRVWLEAT